MGPRVRNNNVLNKQCNSLEGGSWNLLRERNKSIQVSKNAELWKILMTTNPAMTGPPIYS